MSTSQEQLNATMMPVPDVTQVSDGEDEEVVDLEAMARAVMAKLEKDLVEAKARNEGIIWKKQEWANCQAAAKKKEDEEVAEAQWKVDEAAKKSEKGLGAASGKFCLSSPVVQKLTWFPVWSQDQLFRPKTQWWGCPNAR